MNTEAATGVLDAPDGLAVPPDARERAGVAASDQRQGWAYEEWIWPFALSGVAAIIVALRWTLSSRYLFDLDSILYARALDTFDLRVPQPPLPGYYLYIQLGRLVRLVLGDANLSLLAISAAFGALLVVSLFALGRELFDRRTAIVAVLLGLTGPIFWYHSSFASPRIAEAFFATALVWLGFRVRQRQTTWAFWCLVVVLAVAGGVRQQLLIYFAPFSIWATWHVGWAQRFRGAVLGCLVVMAWVVPTLQAAGGYQEYRVLSAVQWQTFVVEQTGVWYGRTPTEMLRRLLDNGAHTIVYAVFTCIPGLLVLTTTLRRVGGLRGIARNTAYQALAVATAPALAFFLLVHIQQIGHLLAIAPFLVLVVARVLAAFPRPLWRTVLVVGTLGINLLFVVVAPSRLIDGHIGTPTVAAIRERDHFIESAVAAIRGGEPDDTLALVSPLAYGFVEQYAPGYTYYLLPGLFEWPGNRPGNSRDQRVLTNGMQLVPAESQPDAIELAAPARVRRFVTVGYEEDLASMLQTSQPIERPDHALSTLAIVHFETPAEVRYSPRRLHLSPRQVANGN